MKTAECADGKCAGCSGLVTVGPGSEDAGPDYDPCSCECHELIERARTRSREAFAALQRVTAHVMDCAECGSYIVSGGCPEGERLRATWRDADGNAFAASEEVRATGIAS